MSDDAKAAAAKSWFGYGRWDAPFWFIGMEPGGDDSHSSYEAWQDLGGSELIDCRSHHLWKREVLGVEDPKWTRWHDDRPGRRTQPTWRRLIQLLLAFKGESTNLDAVYEYQQHKLGRLDGETAVVELGALHAPSLAAEVDRDSFRGERINLLRARLLENQPIFALCYGYGFSEQYVRVIGLDFNAEGFAWCGETLCVLAPGPTSWPPLPGSDPSWWIDKGREMRKIIDAHSASTSIGTNG
jgi:hypothetical protein